MKKISFLLGSFPSGGTGRITIDIADYIRNYGYETTVLAHKSGDEVNGYCPKIIELPEDGPVTTARNTHFIISYINEENIDILVIQGIPVSENIKTLRLGMPGCKIVFALHSMPFWEATYKLHSNKHKANKSIVKSLKLYLITYPSELLVHRYKKKACKDYLNIYCNCDAYVLLCDDYRRDFVRTLGISDEEGKLHVIHNSERIPETVCFDKRKEIIFVGRLTYEDKRVDRLLRIWKVASPQLPEWRLRIVGSGPEQELLMALASRLELERITFEGFHGNVKPFYDTASIICLTSTFEGWPLCLTEAQANGVVPVAFGCSDGVKEIIGPSGVNGIVVSPFDIDAFAGELVALASNEDKLRQMKLNVIEKSKTYSPEVSGKKWVELFNSLCKTKVL